MRRWIGSAAWFAIAALAVAAQAPSAASGWQRDERGAKATALAQAVTAHVDDPSAVYYNPAALEFVRERAFYVGFSLSHGAEAGFVGADPVPGAGVTGERTMEPRARPHLYWVEPVARRWAIGLALTQSAGFETEWKRPDGWAGRFEARKAELRAWDLDAVASVKVGAALGLSAGVVIRASTFDWRYDEGAVIVDLRSRSEIDVGGVLALQHHPPGRWSWGLRWRGGVSSEFDGGAAFAGGQPLSWTTRLQMPDRITLGVAYAPTPTARLEIDLDHTGWASIGDLDIRFTGQPTLDRTPLSGWRDRTATRIGLRWYGLGNGEWRAGLSWDPTPQPESDLGPFFVGADRIGASIGYGTRVRRLQTDMALVWEEHETRSTSTHGFDGEYETRLLRLVLSFGW